MEKKEEKGHLPLYGIGPFYVGVIACLTLAAVLGRDWEVLEGGRIPLPRLPLVVLGCLGIGAGILLWLSAVWGSKIDDGIMEGRLVTTGAYAWVRNPIYSAFMLACDGVLVMLGNAWLLVLAFFYWGLMTFLLKHTEEKWLREAFGQEYEQYCHRVNRCWPATSRKGAGKRRGTHEGL